MKKSLIFSIMAAMTASAGAQQLGVDYVKWPDSGSLHTYVKQWTNGSITLSGETWEDENFFISRVKPKERIRNVNTQVYGNLNESNDKRLIWWVPCGNSSLRGVHTDALPNGIMDSEVFSMWSYVTHYGDWISPYGWVPGSLADVAHKNGVAVSGVASIPFGAIPTGWKTTLRGIAALPTEALGNFMLYHGVDGLGYNSEFSGWKPTELAKQHKDLTEWMSTRNPVFENIWYAGTADNGQVMFDTGIGDHNDELFAGASYFLNYNWNNAGTMQAAIDYAKKMDPARDPLRIYAGFNMQGGEPAGTNWTLLKDFQYSIGLWGAHQINMLWQGRNGKGSSPKVMQRTYIDACEQWFGNGPRNPAIRMDIVSSNSLVPNDTFHGMSSMMTARSSLSWDLAKEPFYTYFNLGNGEFFNWKGNRAMNGEWYSLSVQDYLPTWRFWFAPSFLNGDVKASEVSMKADFTWDDAYVGGSCLNIKGSANTEYLHLFKTDFKVNIGDTITVRYKLLGGAANVRLIFSQVGKESTMVDNARFDVLTTENSAEALRLSHAEGSAGWQTVKIPVNAANARLLGNIAVIALRFENANNLNMLLGELSIVPKDEFVTPETPIVSLSRVYANNYQGVDGKIIFSMPGEKAKPEPTYNFDVHTSMFRLWAQEEGGEPQFMGATTSWAGLIYRAKNTDDSKKIRFGVSALSLDCKSESEIAWGEYLAKVPYVSTDEVQLDKTVIKPNQAFSISYVDPRHESSTWTIYDKDGKKMVEGNGNVFVVEKGLPEVGGYDLVVDEGTAAERRYGYYVQISDSRVGAYPEIRSLTVGDNEVAEDAPAVQIDVDKSMKIGYTGASTDGKASRGLSLNEKMVGAYNNQVGIESQHSFSVAAWIRLDEIPVETWDLFNICDRSGSWPMNNWGWCWMKADTEGRFGMTFRNMSISSNSQEMQYTMPNAQIQPKIWTHLVFVFEYGENGEGFRALCYINGVKQQTTWVGHLNGNSGGGRGEGTTDEYLQSQTFGISAKDMILFGGTAYQGAAAKGEIDDFQIWNKAMTPEDVKASMAGFGEGDEIPEALIGLWQFENEPDEDGNFFSTGSNKNIPAYHFSYEAVQNASEGQNGRRIEQPIFVGGSPFLAGSAYPVTTLPSWKSNHYLTTIKGEGSDTQGSATITFGAAGDHTVTLTLENSWGSDTRTYPVFKAEGTGGIAGVENDDNQRVYTVDDILFVEMSQSGDYTVDVYNTAGVMMARRSAALDAGECMRITLSAPGVYIVNVNKDGKVSRSFKVKR